MESGTHMPSEVKPTARPVICFITGSAGDWGGASRVLYTNLRLLDRSLMDPILLLPCPGPIEAELTQAGLRYRIWGALTEPGNPVRYLRALIRAWFFFRAEKVEVIHVNHSNFWRPAEIVAAMLLRIPIIAHYHVINKEPGPFLKWCRAAVAVSQYTADQSLPRTLDKPVIYNPIHLERFDSGRSLRTEMGLSESDVVVSFLGQIREIKGVQDFIAMAHKIANPEARFLIAGQCRDRKKFFDAYSVEDLTRLIGDDTRIRYVGYIKEVENIYQTSDIIVVPSRWQEPLGLINLEAGACYKPVVATRVGGIPEVIQDGINGYLVEPGDSDALVQRTQYLIDNPRERQQMGAAGRRQVEEKFTTQPVRDFERLLLAYTKRAGCVQTSPG